METIEIKKVIKLNNKEAQTLNEACSILTKIWFGADVEDNIIVSGAKYRNPILDYTRHLLANIAGASNIKVMKGE